MIRTTHLKAAAVGMVLAGSVVANMFLPPSNIDPAQKFSWSENTGWMNWRDANGNAEGVLVGDDFLTGRIWAENIGWIDTGDGNGPYPNTSGTDYGVNILPNGDLEGMGWGENIGWVNFGWGANSASTDKARFDTVDNRFRGWVWAENIGWVNLSDDTNFVAVNLTGAPGPVSGTVDGEKVRFISFVVPTNAPGVDTALRVELTSLHHPANPPVGTPDFSALEGEFRYVNSFGGSTTCVDNVTFATNYRCGQLGCQPEYRDWATALSSATNPPSGAGVIHVTGDAVVPSSTFNVSHIAASCGAAPGANTCAAASAPLAVSTSRWGDVAGSGGTAPDGQANVIDIGVVVDNVKGLPTALPEYRCWMKNPTNSFGNPVNVIDIGLTVDAVKGFAYPYTITLCP